MWDGVVGSREGQRMSSIYKVSYSFALDRISLYNMYRIHTLEILEKGWVWALGSITVQDDQYLRCRHRVEQGQDHEGHKYAVEVHGWCVKMQLDEWRIDHEFPNIFWLNSTFAKSSNGHAARGPHFFHFGTSSNRWKNVMTPRISISCLALVEKSRVGNERIVE